MPISLPIRPTPIVLVVDLEARKLLDKALIVVATEFGRPGGFGGGGRGHHAACFTMVLDGARIHVIQRPRRARARAAELPLTGLFSGWAILH